jgi:hypothetical protein
LNAPALPVRARHLLALLALSAVAAPLAADISGFVRSSVAGNPPIAGVRVHIRLDPASAVFTAADGSFTLTADPPVSVELAASVPYNRANAVNYVMEGGFASNGDTGIVILLDELPAADNPSYVPASAEKSCSGCHNPIYNQWQTANHAGTAQNEWVLDLYSGSGTPGGGAGYVFRDTHDANETGFCSACHAPMAEVLDPGNVFLDEVTDPGALEGVNCVTCHQLAAVDGSPARLNDLHMLGGKSFYRFPEGFTEAFVWGPLTDVTFKSMRPSHSTLHKESLLCASCHQYNRPDNGVAGQHTFTEWQASPFAVPGPGYRTCQDCHMPASTTDGRLCLQLPTGERPGDQRRQHTFVGSTPDMLQNNLALNVTASEPLPGRIRVAADVSNFGAGHNFPTGVAIRNALLVLTATYNGQPLPQVAGPTIPFWGSDEVPGDQPGDYAGAAGKGFAKVLEGRINDQGPTVRPVLFIDGENVFSDTAIPSGGTDNTTVDFQLPANTPAGATVDIEARLLYRRAFRALQVTKGWTQSAHDGPIEIEVASEQLQITSLGTQGIADIPTLGGGALVLLAAALAAAAVAFLARR